LQVPQKLRAALAKALPSPELAQQVHWSRCKQQIASPKGDTVYCDERWRQVNPGDAETKSWNSFAPPSHCPSIGALISYLPEILEVWEVLWHILEGAGVPHSA
jgi:hypothetical protein